MLDISYNNLVQFSRVTDYNDFYRTKLPEMVKIRSLFDNLKLLFNIPGDRILIDVGEGERIYKFTILSKDIKKFVVGWVVYLPLQGRLDLYTSDNPMPLIQWKNKQVIFKNYSMLLDMAGFDTLFRKIVNVI